MWLGGRPDGGPILGTLYLALDSYTEPTKCLPAQRNTKEGRLPQTQVSQNFWTVFYVIYYLFGYTAQDRKCPPPLLVFV
jgi:hypothetical protein